MTSPKRKRDKKPYWQHLGIIKHSHFLELHEVNLEDLERWHAGSLPTEKIRIRPAQRFQPSPDPMSFLDTARHHTTKGRTKSERMMDRYWFVPVNDGVQYRELASSKAIPPRRTTIYPPFLPKGRPKPKAKEEMTCAMCGGPFDAKRRDAKFCSSRCQKAAKRKAAKRLG